MSETPKKRKQLIKIRAGGLRDTRHSVIAEQKVAVNKSYSPALIFLERKIGRRCTI